MANLTCSLNVTIPSSVVITWSHNGSVVTTATPDSVDDVANGTSTIDGNTTTLVIDNLKPSDTGDYQCVLNDVIGSGWKLTRNIRLFITSMFLYYKIVFVCNFSSSLFIALATCNYIQWLITVAIYINKITYS